MAKKITIRMGGYGPPTTTHSRGLKYIGDELNKKFGDSLEIKYIWNVMELGYGSDAVLWLTECGMLDLVYMSTTALTSRVPHLEFLDLPSPSSWPLAPRTGTTQQMGRRPAFGRSLL